MSIDNLLSCQVVTADGRVLTASDSENDDLFWAVRGGGGNFGVVTSFEFRRPARAHRPGWNGRLPARGGLRCHPECPRLSREGARRGYGIRRPSDGPRRVRAYGRDRLLLRGQGRRRARSAAAPVVWDAADGLDSAHADARHAVPPRGVVFRTATTITGNLP